MSDVAAPDGRNLASELVRLSDGTEMDFLRNAEMSEVDWMQTRAYFERNPDEARKLAEYSTNPDKIRKQLSMRAIAEVHQKLIDAGDEDFTRKMKALEEDPELVNLFQDIKAYRVESVNAYYRDDQLMAKVSRKMGGVPRDAKNSLEKIRKTPITLQEACKNGDIKAVQKYLSETERNPDIRELNAKDQRGITCLGYAVGANRLAIAKLLLEAKADALKVDHQGNSALHYAGGYGRQEVADFLISAGVNVNQANNSGLTPLGAALQNKQTRTVELLKRNGATE